MSRAQNLTWCVSCQRWVGASRNWARWQSGQSPEWRVTRHATIPQAAARDRRRPICGVSGILVPPTVVFPREEVDA